MTAAAKRQPVTTDDLYFAIDWLEAYEGGEDDSNVQAVQRLVAMLEGMIDKRQDKAIVRAVAKRAGVSLTEARRAYRQQQAQS